MTQDNNSIIGKLYTGKAFMGPDMPLTTSDMEFSNHMYQSMDKVLIWSVEAFEDIQAVRLNKNYVVLIAALEDGITNVED